MAETVAAKGSTVPLKAFAAGTLIALLVGVIGKAHDPTLDGTTTLGFDTVLEMKTAVSCLIGVLVVLQLLGALVIYGKLGLRAPSWLGPAHRASGTVTLVLALVVAYHCLWALGLESGTFEDGTQVPLRTVAHGVLGCALMGAIVVKIVAVRSRRAPGWFLPVAGGLLVTLFALTLLTSVAWYLTAKGWPTHG